jgi:transcriptional regulator with XRE-family HTH domain
MSISEMQAASALGVRLLSLRESARLGQATMATLAELGERHLRRLEHGERRTRRSTLERIATAATRAQPALGDSDAVLRELLSVAGVALAEESTFRDRVDQRRTRRTRRRRRREVTEHVTRWVDSGWGVVEHHSHSWPDGARRIRHRSFTRIPGTERAAASTDADSNL